MYDNKYLLSIFKKIYYPLFFALVEFDFQF